MRIAVFGTGGVGGYFGGRLAQAGEDVTFIARGAHLKALQAHGLQVESIKGDFNVQPVKATERTQDVGVVDVVLVALKAWQVPEAAEAIKPMLGSETMVLPLQNGVEAPEQLAHALGDAHVLVGLTRIISFIGSPGRICHTGAEPYIAFGERDNRRTERVEHLRQTFERAQISVEVPADMQVALWEKFMMVVSWGSVGAVTRAPIGAIRDQMGSREMLQRAISEIDAVGRGHGVALPADAVGRTLAMLDTLPAGGTTSLQRDILEGKPSELEAWTGSVVRLGQEVGVTTPLHDFIYHSLLLHERRARGLLSF